ncbi:MAG: chromosome segregation protein SMC [Firmicutes bacterium]|nr:chromosome segregation protein SMC [Bacillota bacterium]
MELKRVEIVGFKSFPEKIRVEFGEGVTAIVGPNGSGKSNIADAVRWVLGEQSAKTLRGARMDDVIFAGTERRKPLGYAEVTLVLDNSDRKMPVDYNEVSISRRIFRSGESEYAINGGRCRLRDVQEMLMDTGIGKEGYSLIGQGQIDQLLSSKPQDRRAIFEEAAGITKFKTRRDQAQKQLADEASKLERVSDILNELNARIEPLKKQSETAQQYLSLKEELKLYEVSSFIGEYELLKTQSEKLDQSLSALEEQISASREKEAEAKEKADQLAQDVDENRKKLLRLNQELGELKLSLETSEGDKRVLKEQINHYQEDMDSYQIRILDLKERIADRTHTLEKEEARIRSLDQTIEEQENSLKTKEESFVQLSGKLEEQSKKEKEAARKLNEAEEELQFATASRERFVLLASQDREQMKSRVEETAALRIRKEEGEKQIGILSRQTEEIAHEIENLLSEEKKADTQYQENKTRSEELVRSQESLMLELKDLQGRIGWLSGLDQDYEGFSGSVKALMKLKRGTAGSREARLGSAIHGTIADIIEVDKRYTVAMDVALGAGLQNVIVDNTSGVRSLIDYLREKRIGRATFMPLDQVTARNPFQKEAEVLSMPGVIGFADSLVGVKEIYRKVISRQLGGVVVCENFDSASAVSRRFGNSLRVVTLDGDIFNIGGSITGGSNHQQKSGILGRKAEMDELKGTLKEKRQEADQIYKKTREISEALRLSGEETRKIRLELSKKRTEETDLRAQLEKYRGQMEEVESRLTEARLQDEDADKIRQEHEKALKESEARLQKAESLRKEAAEKLDQEQNARTLLEEELAAGKEEKQNLMIRLAGTRQEKQFLTQQKVWETTEIDHLSQEAESLIDESNLSSEALKNTMNKVESLEKEQEKTRDLIEQMQNSIKDQESVFQTVDDEREQALRETEDILRSFSVLEKEQVRLDAQSARARKELEELQDRMWEDYEITYGAAKELAARKFNDDEQMLAASELSKTKRRQMISRLKEQIRALGPVNVGAITEYKSLTERCAFLSGQRDDILKSEQNLTDIIRQMTTKMEEQFKSGFAAIAESFDQVFKLMFGGGRGILRLSEEEESLEAGIEIIAQPPGKKLQNMLLLSGGERALTAIALLFAIQQLNPAPFCILDEIEAALDDANVERFAGYLRQMCSETQFIVITHRKGTMVAADTLYGVTMEEKGVSKCISVNFDTSGEDIYGAV